MAIGSLPITWDLKHTDELWVYIGTPLPNPSGHTGVMVCVTIYPLVMKIVWNKNKKKKTYDLH